ncbi:unnamed protein product, partial [Absidia cylindrospora]
MINNYAATCTCPYNCGRKYPCKHIFMLERFLQKTIPVLIPSSLSTPMNMLVEESANEIQMVVHVADVEEVVEASGSSDGGRVRQAMFMSEMAQFIDVVSHQKEDMLRMTNVSDEDARHGQKLMQNFKEFYETLERKSTNHFRMLNSQR